MEGTKIENENQTEKSKKGKKGRAKGKRFELDVRRDLEEKGWVIVKWTNQIDFEKDKLVPAKSKFNPFLGRVMSSGTGWPDYLGYKRLNFKNGIELIGIESKYGKYLDAEEKRRALWLLNKRIFDKILIAYKKERGKIDYEEFAEKK